LRDDFYADGLKQRNEQVNSVQTQMKQLVGKTASIKADVDEVSATLTEQLDDTVVGSYAYQTAQEIGAKVSVTDGNTQSFGWTLNSSQWTVYASNYPIMIVNSSGMILNGTIGAQGFLTQSGNDKTRIKNGSVMTNAVYLYPSGSTWSDEGDSQGYIASNDMLLGSFNDAYLRIFKNGTAYKITSNGSVRAEDFDVGDADYADNAGQAATSLFANKSTSTDELYGGGTYAYVSANGNLRPKNDGGASGVVTSSCGTADGRWTSVWSVNGTIQTSDERRKRDIKALDPRYLDLILELAPRSYKMVEGESGRTHCGFIAQEVESLMSKYGIDNMEFAGFVKAPLTDEDGNIVDYLYALRYDEFVPLLTLAIQHQEQRLTSLEERISRLEMKNNE
jgi:hypothetical protein